MKREYSCVIRREKKKHVVQITSFVPNKNCIQNKQNSFAFRSFAFLLFLRSFSFSVEYFCRKNPALSESKIADVCSHFAAYEKSSFPKAYISSTSKY